MTTTTRCPADTLAEIDGVVDHPAERAPGCPFEPPGRAISIEE